jgi:hypothetical protein
MRGAFFMRGAAALAGNLALFSGDIEAKPRRSFRTASTAILLGGKALMSTATSDRATDAVRASPTRRMPPRQKSARI